MFTTWSCVVTKRKCGDDGEFHFNDLQNEMPINSKRVDKVRRYICVLNKVEIIISHLIIHTHMVYRLKKPI